MDLFIITVKPVHNLGSKASIQNVWETLVYREQFIWLIPKEYFGKVRSYLNMRHIKIYKLIYIQQSELASTFKNINKRFRHIHENIFCCGSKNKYDNR